MKNLIPQSDLFGNPVEGPKVPPLQERFLIPPFSVLDARQGYWQDRKREWIDLGIKGELGRGGADGGCFGQDLIKGENPNFGKPDGTLYKASQVAGFDHYRVKEGTRQETDARGTSVFDPVLCELVYRWFCPDRGTILDPFAGESTKGIVAAYLGFHYVGVELRCDQVAVNRLQADKIVPR
jgi:hypothetical protein